MTSISPPPRSLMGPRDVNAHEQNGPRDSSNRRTHFESWQRRLLMNRLLSVFAPEFPILPLSNATYIQNSPFAENALNRPTTSAGDSHSSVPNISTTPTGNRNRRRIDSQSAEGMGWSSDPFVIKKESHERRKSKLGKALEPMLGDGRAAASVFLCWSEEHGCQIIPVNIASSDDEAAGLEKKNSRGMVHLQRGLEKTFAFLCR